MEKQRASGTIGVGTVGSALPQHGVAAPAPGGHDVCMAPAYGSEGSPSLEPVSPAQAHRGSPKRSEVSVALPLGKDASVSSLGASPHYTVKNNIWHKVPER